MLWEMVTMLNATTHNLNRQKRLAWIIAGALVIYLVGLLILPLVIMLTSTTSFAPLVSTFNAIYAPFVVALQKVPFLGSAWTAYMNFLCEVTHYSCSLLPGIPI